MLSRIVVIGRAGSGKSRLALRLAEEMGIPVYHTDRMGWRAGWRRTPFAVYRREVEAIVTRPAWIIEGTSPRTLEIRFGRADIVIWLSPPLALCLWRVVRRTWRNLGRNRDTVAAGCPERFSLHLFVRIVTFDNRVAARIERAIAACGMAGRTLRLGSAIEIKRLDAAALRSLHNTLYARSPPPGYDEGSC